MAAIVSRIQLRDGTVYEARKPWPGVSTEGVGESEQIKVALITYFPEQEEPSFDGDGDEAEEIGSDRHPARYEVWAANDRLYSVVAGLVSDQQVPEAEAEYVASLGSITRRIVYAHEIALVDEEWSVRDGLKQMASRLYEMLKEQLAEKAELDKAAAEEAKKNGQPQPEQPTA